MKQHDVKEGRLDYCQICGSKNLFEGIDLGFQPSCDPLLTEETIHNPETYYPLRLMICSECGNGQLDYVINKDIVYPMEYSYRPGISIPLREHLERLADDVIEKNKLQPRDVVVDIGSNDGTLLLFFQKQGMYALGVEPTNMAKVANANGIDTIQKFFNIDVALDIVEKYGRAKIITFTNVFAHMATLGEVMEGLTELLDENGAIVSESQYLLDVFEGNQFDEIYHGHVRIYSLKSLVKLFSLYGLEVFDAERILTREGSIKVSAGWKGTHGISPNVQKLLQAEETASLFDPQAWQKFRVRVETQKKHFLDLVHDFVRNGSLVADSCPTRGVVLLNYYGLKLPYVAQLPGTEKVGKYIPGTHTPIVSNEIILKDQPEYILILAWHYSDYIIKNWRAKGVKSKFIIPLPTFQIV